MSTLVTTAEVAPFVIGGGILLALLFMMGVLLMFGAGRDHS